MTTKEELAKTQPVVPLPERLVRPGTEPDLLEELERTQEFKMPEGEPARLPDTFYQDRANEQILKKMAGLAYRHSGYGGPIIIERIAFSEEEGAFVVDVENVKTGNHSKMTMDEFLAGLPEKDRRTLDAFFASR